MFYSVENLVEKPVGKQDKTHEFTLTTKYSSTTLCLTSHVSRLTSHISFSLVSRFQKQTLIKVMNSVRKFQFVRLYFCCRLYIGKSITSIFNQFSTQYTANKNTHITHMKQIELYIAHWIKLSKKAYSVWNAHWLHMAFMLNSCTQYAKLYLLMFFPINLFLIFYA